MEYIGYAAAIVVGLAFGLYFGRLLTAVVTHWEGTATAVKWSTAVIGFLLGGGGGAVIFRVLSGTSDSVFYLLGLGVGMIAAFFFPRMPARYSLETFKHVVKMSDALRDEVPDPEERALLILAPFTPPKSIAREADIDENELASRLEHATDSLGKSDDQSETNNG